MKIALNNAVTDIENTGTFIPHKKLTTGNNNMDKLKILKSSFK